MDRLRQLFKPDNPYHHVETDDDFERDHNDEEHAPQDDFSWTAFSIFLLLGVAMLWAWNMFLAAGPYFISRFQSDEWILDHFQSVELSVSSITLLSSVFVLSQLQESANYASRILLALVINIVTFTLLAISTKSYVGVSAGTYFVFLILMVFLSSLAAGLMQNGIFAYVAGFGVERYVQGIMTGQAVAGVLPALIQIVAAVSVPSRKFGNDDGKNDKPQLSSTSAFSYFLTATGVSLMTLVAFTYLVRSRTNGTPSLISSVDLQQPNHHKNKTKPTVPLTRLFRQLRWYACAVFLTFAVTMVFPVFTQKILSVTGTTPANHNNNPNNINANETDNTAPPLLQPAAFIPLAFFVWNLGDLIGRLLTAPVALSLTSRPRTLFALAVARILFVPMYLLCNVGGHGAIVRSDAFYLGVVQLLFGVSNGYIGSSCMMAAGLPMVADEEREAAGAFMGFCLVFGLSVGSLLSFGVAGV